MVREGIERTDHPRRTAILGTSRLLFNFSHETFAKRHPGVPVAQLAIPAKGPLKAFETFAFKTDFKGVLLLEFSPESFLPPREDEQADYIDYYDSRWSIDEAWNLRLASLLEPRLVTRHYNYSLDSLVRTWWNRRTLPTAALYLRVQEDREHDADFSIADLREMEEIRVGPLLDRYRNVESIVDVEWPRTLARLAAAASAIHRRGGCVVLVRAPEGGKWLELHERLFGTETFWTHALDTIGAHGIDLLRAESQFKLPLPDGQHVDFRDQARFTDLLIDKLDAIGIYTADRSCHPSAKGQ